MSKNSFENVSLLITHYNRSSSLLRLLNKLQELGIAFGEIIVSDDCSNPDHLSKLRQMETVYGFKLVTTPINRGLGNNINKGQDLATKDYTLYVQEDFVPTESFAEHFIDALSLMNDHAELDIARFYGYVRYPYSKPFEKGYRLMDFKFYYPGYLKFYVYSDHPHLRRSNFFEKFGRYREGVNVDVSEYNMCLAFLKNGGKGFFYPEISSLFLQLNNSQEPSTASFRKDWRLSQNLFVRAMRAVYLQYKTFKFHKDYLRYPVKKAD